MRWVSVEINLLLLLLVSQIHAEAFQMIAPCVVVALNIDGIEYSLNH